MKRPSVGLGVQVSAAVKITDLITPALLVDAGLLAALARSMRIYVRGVMGYGGHLMMEDEATKAEKVEAAMALLLRAHDAVGGDVISGGGTGTYATNTSVTELQAGSFALM